LPEIHGLLQPLLLLLLLLLLRVADKTVTTANALSVTRFQH